MKHLLIFLIVFSAGLAFGQSYDQGVFGTSSAPAEYDTLGATDDSLSSRIVYWPAHFRMRGNHTVWGKMWLLDSTTVNVTIKYTPLYGSTTSSRVDCGTQQTLGTISVADSTKYEYSIPAQTWDKYSKGFVIDYVPAATGRQIRVRGKSMAK